VTDAPDRPHLVAYDELSMLHENAVEYGLTFDAPPLVRRVDVGGISALRWGSGDPRIVLVHGTAQNAHTWDSVMLALGCPDAVAVDLPGHGHSLWKPDHAYAPRQLADDLAPVLDVLAPNAHVVVGMSLGGLTCVALAVRHPRLVRSLVVVDITPGTNREKAKAIIDFVDGPQSFPDLDALLARTVEHNPTRSVSSLRRGVLHNARQQPDGSWAWRYDRTGRPGALRHTGSEAPPAETSPEMNPLWDDVAALGARAIPVLLARGGVSPVVDGADIAEWTARVPDGEVVVVDGAGHSIQGDRPIELAALIAARLG
jgi:pimeloyl-ACP methyl ester carboxylesterase